MKRLNNKGFAISTLIYGLAVMGIMIVAILMATMAKNRTNSSSLVRAIEDELNRFSKTETTFRPVNDDASKIESQEYIVPEGGWYKVELWGTQGGGNGGKGAYTGGVIRLEKDEKLYFYVGKHSDNNVGGFAAEVRTVNGAYTEFSSVESAIMVAAGGGTESTAAGGTLYGYNNKMESYGGFINVSGNKKDFSLLPLRTEANDNKNNTNGTLIGYTKDYEVSSLSNTILNKAYGEHIPVSHVGENGGGDGFVSSNSSAIGGTSYIAGYAGCFGVSKGLTTSTSRVEYYDHTYDASDPLSEYIYSNTMIKAYYFIDATMLPGVNTGDGYAKIERVKGSQNKDVTLVKKNNRLNDVKYIRTCTNTATTTRIFTTIQGYTSEQSPINPKPEGEPEECVSVYIGGQGEKGWDVDEITVFHTNSGVDYEKLVIQVSKDQTNWKDVKKTADDTKLSETETVIGTRVSAYQNDPYKALPTGNYIIQPVLSENKVLTAAETSEGDADPLTIEPYNGEKRQRWNIELITDKKINPNYDPNTISTYEYKIVELARNKALTINNDENIVFNTVSTMTKFNEKARNEPQIWKINPVGDGTYTIETVMPQVTPTANTGYLTPQTNSIVENYNKIIIGKKNISTARFKLIQIDYSSN